MSTLPALRALLRQDLHDPEAITWDNDTLDRHIGRALAELSLACPRELTAAIATTPGSRDVDISSLDSLIEVEAVEYPAGQFPPAYLTFSTWGATLALHTPVAPDGSSAQVSYTALHTLDDEGTTLPVHLEEVLLTGAGAYAALEASVGTTNTLNLEPEAARTYAAFARARQTAFQQLLHTYGRKNRVRPRRMYTPA